MLNGYKIIALCLAKISEEFSRHLVKYLNEYSVPKGYRVFVYCTDNDMFWSATSDMGEKSVFDLVDFSWADVLVYYDECLKSEASFRSLYKKATEAGKPVINLDGHRDGCININFDYIGGFRDMVEHVVEHHKVKKIHYMSGIKGNAFSDEREGVVRSVMSKNGLTLTDHNISYGSFWSLPTRRAMEQLLKNGDIPEAIICANDAMALEVSVDLTKAGIRIPEDVIVTGFDGLEETFYSKPQITTCVCDFKVVAKKIMDLIEDERPYEEKIGEYLVKPSLRLSESCGCGERVEVNVAERIGDLSQMLNTYQSENRVLEEISARIQTCSDVSVIAKELRNVYMQDMAVILKKECLDDSINPMELKSKELFGEDFVIMLDTNNSGETGPISFSRDQIVPHLRRLLEEQMPLIFTALHFLNVPMGYACFFYKNYSRNLYNKVFQHTSMLDNALGGFRNVRFQQYLQRQVEDNYRLDSLTGLYNRTGFFREFDVMIEELRQSGGTLTMVLADLDNLKYINDNFGHSEGDKAICAVANAIKRACPDALCCRFGGDEMVAVIAEPLDYRAVCSRVDMIMDEYNGSAETAFPFSASIGIYTVTEPELMDFDEMLKVADAQMYEVKRSKKVRRGEI